MKKLMRKEILRKKRHRSVRKKVNGTSERPRLCVFRSLKHIYAQIIDDSSGNVIASASTLSSGLKGNVKSTGNREAASIVGETIAKEAKEKGVASVVFDRNGYLYHGRVKALADSARQNGLKF